MAAEQLGDGDRVSKRDDTWRKGWWHTAWGPERYVAHKSDSGGVPRGKRIPLEWWGPKRRTLQDDEGREGVRARPAVITISCPVLTCPF